MADVLVVDPRVAQREDFPFADVGHRHNRSSVIREQHFDSGRDFQRRNLHQVDLGRAVEYRCIARRQSRMPLPCTWG